MEVVIFDKKNTKILAIDKFNKNDEIFVAKFLTCKYFSAGNYSHFLELST